MHVTLEAAASSYWYRRQLDEASRSRKEDDMDELAFTRVEVDALGTCPGFDATLAATATRRYRAGPPIAASVTVAFGSRDRLLLPWQSRRLDELPVGTHLVTLPGCGHVPMGDNPATVTALITAVAGRGLAASAFGAE
jgi:pimeloyl-ACP methyl ester carboxylesterase